MNLNTSTKAKRIPRAYSLGPEKKDAAPSALKLWALLSFCFIAIATLGTLLGSLFAFSGLGASLLKPSEGPQTTRANGSRHPANSPSTAPEADTIIQQQYSKYDSLYSNKQFPAEVLSPTFQQLSSDESAPAKSLDDLKQTYSQRVAQLSHLAIHTHVEKILDAYPTKVFALVTQTITADGPLSAFVDQPPPADASKALDQKQFRRVVDVWEQGKSGAWVISEERVRNESPAYTRLTSDTNRSQVETDADSALGGSATEGEDTLLSSRKEDYDAMDSQRKRGEFPNSYYSLTWNGKTAAGDPLTLERAKRDFAQAAHDLQFVGSETTINSIMQTSNNDIVVLLTRRMAFRTLGGNALFIGARHETDDWKRISSTRPDVNPEEGGLGTATTSPGASGERWVLAYTRHDTESPLMTRYHL